jgi:hypothetical protein
MDRKSGYGSMRLGTGDGVMAEQERKGFEIPADAVQIALSGRHVLAGAAATVAAAALPAAGEGAG